MPPETPRGSRLRRSDVSPIFIFGRSACVIGFRTVASVASRRQFPLGFRELLTDCGSLQNWQQKINYTRQGIFKESVFHPPVNLFTVRFLCLIVRPWDCPKNRETWEAWQGVLNFYLYEVEDDLEIIFFSSFEFHDVFRHVTKLFGWNKCLCQWISTVWAFQVHYEMCPYTCILPHERKVSAFIAKWIPDVSVDFWPAYWCTTVVHQHGGSIQNSVKFCETLPQITQRPRTERTWELETWFTNVAPTTFQVFGLFHRTVLIFFCVVWQWKRSIFNKHHSKTVVTVTSCRTMWPAPAVGYFKALYNEKSTKINEAPNITKKAPNTVLFEPNIRKKAPPEYNYVYAGCNEKRAEFVDKSTDYTEINNHNHPI